MVDRHKLYTIVLILVLAIYLSGKIQNGMAQTVQSFFNLEKEFITTNTDSNATLLGIWENEIVKNTSDLFVKDNYLYLANKNDGLYILDINNPSNPILKGSCLFSDYSRCLTVNEGYVYIGNEGLRIIDIHDPSNPVETGYYNTGGYIEKDIVVLGNYVYIADANDHLYIVDISDKSNPYLKGEYDAGADLTAVDVEGDYAYVGIDYWGNNKVEREFRVIDVSDPANPTEVGKYDGWWGRSSLPAGSNRPIKSILAKGSYLYVINHYMGLGIFDISDPQNPTEAGFYYGYRGSVYDISLEGNYAYVSDYDCKIIDINNPSTPELSGLYTLDYDHYYVPKNTAQDGVVYVAAENLFIIQNNLITDVKENNDLKPQNFVLEQNYPNPFNPVTTIQFYLKKDSRIRLNVYNTIGQKVVNIANEFYTAGLHKVKFDGSHLPSGIYIYKILTKSFSESRKMMLMR